MKIAIVSDTHGNEANFKKAVQWINKQKIKIILHCGDIGSSESLKESLEDFKGEFFGVFGNMDDGLDNSVDYYKKIPNAKIEKKTLEAEIDEKCIAITHFPAEARELVRSGKYNMVFYGHTHKAYLARQNLKGEGGGRKECLLINPGEMAGHFFKPTFAVYDTKTDILELKILEKL